MSGPARSPLPGPVRALAAWWRSRSELLQGSVLAAISTAAAFARAHPGAAERMAW